MNCIIWHLYYMNGLFERILLAIESMFWHRTLEVGLRFLYGFPHRAQLSNWVDHTSGTKAWTWGSSESRWTSASKLICTASHSYNIVHTWSYMVIYVHIGSHIVILWTVNSPESQESVPLPPIFHSSGTCQVKLAQKAMLASATGSRASQGPVLWTFRAYNK
jgi:hypothetical protein